MSNDLLQQDLPNGPYARALFRDAGATLDDLRESVATLEEMTRTARRVLGGAHATTVEIEGSLRDARFTLRARVEHPGLALP